MGAVGLSKPKESHNLQWSNPWTHCLLLLPSPEIWGLLLIPSCFSLGSTQAQVEIQMSPKKGSSTKCSGMQGSTRPRGLACRRIPHLRLLLCRLPVPLSSTAEFILPRQETLQNLLQHEAEVAAKGTLP